MTKTQLLNEYYNIVSNDIEIDDKARLNYITKHNRILDSLSKKELKEVYKYRYGRLTLETAEELKFVKENYKGRLEL